MVSRIPRHLSIFLVATIVMSYFISPTNLNAQSSASTTSADTITEDEASALIDEALGGNVAEIVASKDGVTEEEVQPDACLDSFNPANDSTKTVFNAGIILSRGIPPYLHQCFTLDEDGETIIHKFKYKLQGQDGDTIWEQRFTPAKKTDPSLPKIYAGCVGISSISAAGTIPIRSCQQNAYLSRDYFAYGENDVKLTTSSSFSAVAGSGGSINETKQVFNEEVELYQFDTALSPRPNAFLVVSIKNKLVYGLYEMNTARLHMSPAQRKADRTKSFTTDDLKFIAPKNSGTDYANLPIIQHYIASMNGLISKQRPVAYPFQPVSPVTVPNAADRSAYTRQGVKNLFGSITNSFILRAGREKDLTLEDSSADPNPTTPPVVRISKAATGLPQDLTPTLRYLPYVSTRIDLTQLAFEVKNNYFFFAFDKLSDDMVKSFNIRGIDPDLIYLAIDVGGNIAFVVEDTSNGGGIFQNDRKKLDPFVVFGKFDSDNQVSTNLLNESLHIDREEYKQVLTTRVYNEPQVPKSDGKDCGALVLYPQLNIGYADESFPDGIPKGDYRKCINTSPDGWLSTWGVQIKKLDSLKDPCVLAFEQKGNYWFNFFVGGPMGRSVCWVVGVATNAAVWMAGFSVDFLIGAVGLQ